GLLAVQPMVEKAEVERRARIEKRRVRDLVLQRLGDGRVVTIRANLDLMPSRVRGQRGIGVAAPEAPLLKRDDRRRKRVRPQVRRKILDGRAHAQQKPRRNLVRPSRLAEIFTAVAVLAL